MSKQSRRVAQKRAGKLLRKSRNTFKKGRAGTNSITLKVGEYPVTPPTAKSGKNSNKGRAVS